MNLMAALLSTGFAFVLNVLDVNFDAPVELVPGHWFRRASDED